MGRVYFMLRSKKIFLRFAASKRGFGIFGVLLIGITALLAPIEVGVIAGVRK